MERAKVDVEARRVWRLSWVAYAWPLLKYGVVLSILASIEFVPWWVEALVAGRLVYRLAYLATVKVIVNEDGIWKHFGLLPWSSGAAGVKWRDLDQAEIFLGFLPWLTGSHTVRVGHRFTKSSELLVPHVADARGLIAAINGEHDRLAKAGALT